ncbi:MAG: M15 family metallopeptidase [Deltaproteobacteria bacterium]|nr:M15 family metallopeptidase [Myxococcales bacterium]MDP3214248.1 M15 family metallopeptidase [Deltaproteobacteria bacterium]
MRRSAALTLTLLAAASAASAQTVATVAARRQCSTAGVEGLSRQLVETQICRFPGVFVNAAPRAGINLSSSRVFTLAQASARDALWAAARTTPLTINSMFRTLADQYVLYHSGACGLAATPGSSNHETGIAVDLQNWSAALRAMGNAGCRHPYPGRDDVHFDCPGTDRRADSVRTFQRLWNVNNAGDRIDEDGAYGPMTAARVARSPAGGFARNGCAPAPPATPAYAATLLTVSCPREATSGERPVAYVEYRNTGTATWDTARTRLGTTGPRDRRGVFYDAVNWVSATRPSNVDRATANGAVGRFSFVLAIPEVSADTTLSETYGLVQEGVTWFGPADTAVRCAVLVHPRARDAGTPDVGVPDVGVADIGVADVGSAEDAGSIEDAGTEDAGTEDVATVDVGSDDDAGWSDAGPVEEGYVNEGGDGGDADPMGDMDGGCQCHTGVGAKPPGGAMSLLLGALVLAWRRRRKRA